MIWTAWRILGYVSEHGQAYRVPRQPQTYRWRISRLKATPAEYIGEVEAPDEASAIKKAIEEFQITERWKQSRLVAQRRARPS
jgi:uncharacterized protein YdiU (UPF0061 family)